LAGKPNVYREYKDKDIMTNLYVNQRLSAKEIAGFIGCGENTVLRWLKKHGIKALASTFEVPPKFKNAEEMYKECIRQGKRWEEITIQAPKDAIL